MTFDETLSQVLALLRREGRVSYRALKCRFDLDDDYLDDLKAEIIQAKKLAVDEDGAVLVWIGDTAAAPAPVNDQERAPLVYTPAYLAEKILASRAALEGERKQAHAGRHAPLRRGGPPLSWPGDAGARRTQLRGSRGAGDWQ